MSNQINKRKAATGQTDTVQTIGLDIGYGVVKAVTDTQNVVFPSVAGHAREIKFRADEIARKYPGDQISDEFGSWFVGDLATMQIPAGELLRLRGRTANETAQGNVFRVRMMRVALGKLFAGHMHGDVIHIRIATGLPVDHMRDAADLKSALIGQHLIRTDTAHFIANITECMVMPQPYGTIYSSMITSTGDLNPCHTTTRTGVVDVGTYTVDLALDDDGEYVDAESGSVEAGVWTAQQRIATVLENDFREKPTYKMIETALRTGCVTAFGQTRDYTEEVQDALMPTRDATLGIMSEKWRTGMNVDGIKITGGGAILVVNHIKQVYRQAEVAQQSQLANAIGYRNYAQFSAKV